MSGRSRILPLILTILIPLIARAQNPYGQWSNGPSREPGYFPIAVWLQDPRNATAYRAAGFNTYIGLWQGPTEKQLTDLAQAGMHVICDQNDVALKHLSDKTIIGWMHGDEPDNAQELPDKKGYGPPILPEKIIAEYRQMQTRDPSRPVMLNFGQGVAWDGWFGRGVRSNHPEDYAEYLKGCDIASFDIYPVNHDRPEVADKLWLVPFGVDRLRQWSADQKIVWNCIECTRIGDKDAKPTPLQVRAEVWMSLIHGSRGLIYFVHQFKPAFVEAALLRDNEMLAEVTRLNKHIASLAAALNSPTIAGVKVSSSNANMPVDAMAKRVEGSLYIFAVAMRDGQTRATIELPNIPKQAHAELLEEGRTIEVVDGKLIDNFTPWQVHRYRIND